MHWCPWKCPFWPRWLRTIHEHGSSFKSTRRTISAIMEKIYWGRDYRHMLGDFYWRQIWNQKFENLLLSFEKAAFQSIVAVINNFFGNHRADNYREIVATVVENMHWIPVNMSAKIHYSHQHLDFFRENLGKISDEVNAFIKKSNLSNIIFKANHVCITKYVPT